MINKFLLREKREEDFAKWYSRWFKKQNFEKQIDNTNNGGGNFLSINLYDTPGFNILRYSEFKKIFQSNLIFQLRGIDVKFNTHYYNWGGKYTILELSWKVEYDNSI